MAKNMRFWFLFYLPSIFISACFFAEWAIIVGMVIFLPISLFFFLWAMAWYRRLWLAGGLPTLDEENESSCETIEYTYYQKPCCPTFCGWARCCGYFSLVKIKRIAGRSSLENIRAGTCFFLNLAIFISGIIMWVGFVKDEISSTTSIISYSTVPTGQHF